MKSLAPVANSSLHPTIPGSRAVGHALGGMAGGSTENVTEVSTKYRLLIIQSAPAVSFGPGERAGSVASPQCSTLLADITNILSKAPLQRLPLAASHSIPFTLKQIRDLKDDLDP